LGTKVPTCPHCYAKRCRREILDHVKSRYSISLVCREDCPPPSGTEGPDSPRQLTRYCHTRFVQSDQSQIKYSVHTPSGISFAQGDLNYSSNEVRSSSLPIESGSNNK